MNIYCSVMNATECAGIVPVIILLLVFADN